MDNGWRRLLDLDYQSSSQNQPQFQPAYVQPQYPPYQPQYPPQQPGFSPQQQYSGYPPYQGVPPQQYPPKPQFGFRNEIIDMKNKYGMNIPEEQID